MKVSVILAALLACLASCTSSKPKMLPHNPTTTPTPIHTPTPTPAQGYTSIPVIQPTNGNPSSNTGQVTPTPPVGSRPAAPSSPQVAMGTSLTHGRGCGFSYNCFPALTPASYLVASRISRDGLNDLFARCRAVAGVITSDCRWLMKKSTDIFSEVPENVLIKGRELFAACEVGMVEEECVDEIVNNWRVDILDSAWPRWGPTEMEEGEESTFYFRLYASKAASRNPEGDGSAESPFTEAHESTSSNGRPVTVEPLKYSHNMCFNLRLSDGSANIEADKSLEVAKQPELGIPIVCSKANLGTSTLLHEARWKVTPTSSKKLVLLVRPFYRFRDEDGYRPALLASDPIEVTITPRKSWLQIATEWFNDHLIPFLIALAVVISLLFAIVKRRGNTDK